MNLPIEKREEINNPVPIFQHLLAEPVANTRLDLRVTEWFDEESIDQVDTLWEQFRLDFGNVVDKLTTAIRNPDFIGSYEDKGFPEELEGAAHLAYWLYPDRAIFVMCDQQDQETPIAFSIGMAPINEFTPRESDQPEF